VNGVVITLREIIERCSMLGLDEERCNSDKYSELVFYKTEIDEWSKILADVLGPAVKRAGKKPTKDHLYLTKDYGGIWIAQTLFKRDFDDVSVIAMFWPWQDGIHATLKLALGFSSLPSESIQHICRKNIFIKTSQPETVPPQDPPEGI